MYFRHARDLWTEFPQLAAGVVLADGITARADVRAIVERHVATARSRLARQPESELPEIQAWRRAFAELGLKPTGYRCASEALLRRLRKEGELPRIHPLIDLCNAVSVAFAVPIAVFDVARLDGYLEVRRAGGDESYLAFSGETEQPERDEVIFVDASGRAHARRWTNRQSLGSAVRPDTATALVVAEALHESAGSDLKTLVSTLGSELEAVWGTKPRSQILSAESPRFDF